MRKFLRYPAIFILLIAIVGAVLLFTPLGERPLTTLFAVGDVEAVDFAALTLTDKPNRFLVCPADLCGAKAHVVSPAFDISVERLRAGWRKVVAARPNVELLAEYGDGWQIDYVQRSARFRFPDIVTVRFISIAPSRSTLAIYSRSIYGQSDLGVNARRIDAWLVLLHEGL